eukprot:3066297-Pyramimonas_sp.AAC.1
MSLRVFRKWYAAAIAPQGAAPPVSPGPGHHTSSGPAVPVRSVPSPGQSRAEPALEGGPRAGRFLEQPRDSRGHHPRPRRPRSFLPL